MIIQLLGVIHGMAVLLRAALHVSQPKDILRALLIGDRRSNHLLQCLLAPHVLDGFITAIHDMWPVRGCQNWALQKSSDFSGQLFTTHSPTQFICLQAQALALSVQVGLEPQEIIICIHHDHCTTCGFRPFMADSSKGFKAF